MNKIVGVRFFPESIAKLASVNSCANALINWMAHNINEENICSLRYHEKMEFIGVRIDKEPWSVRTVNNALYQLKVMDMIHSKYQSTFFVNPNYFCKTDSEVKRDILIAAYKRATDN